MHKPFHLQWWQMGVLGALFLAYWKKPQKRLHPAYQRVRQAPERPRDKVDEASWESFPASDPPGY